MTYFDLKEILRQINTQKLKVQEAREQAYKTTANVGENAGTTSDSTQDKIGIKVCKIDEEENKLKALELELEYAICKIPDPHIRKVVTCKLKHRWSWKKIAVIIGGNNTGDGIRKMCTRYFW